MTRPGSAAEVTGTEAYFFAIAKIIRGRA